MVIELRDFSSCGHGGVTHATVAAGFSLASLLLMVVNVTGDVLVVEGDPDHVVCARPRREVDLEDGLRGRLLPCLLLPGPARQPGHLHGPHLRGHAGSVGRRAHVDLEVALARLARVHCGDGVGYGLRGEQKGLIKRIET